MRAAPSVPLLFAILTSMVPHAAAQMPQKDPDLPAPPGPAELLSLPATRPDQPTIWIAGDSTAGERTAHGHGVGVPFSALLESGQVNVINRARGGRSSRTFVTEGWWEAISREVKAGDWVLIQFGHNDAGAVNDASRARGSLRGTGDETEEIDNLVTKKPETVHSYGWYLRKMITDTRARGATPLVLSLTVRNEWQDGRVKRQNGPWNQLAAETAKMTGVQFLDLTTLIADAYDAMGPDKVKLFFPRDHTHTGPEGADLTAHLLVKALYGLKVPVLASKPD